MRIRVINPFGGTEFRGRENLARIKRSGTEFDMVNIADDYPLKNNQFLYFRHKCTDATLEQVMQAQAEMMFDICRLTGLPPVSRTGFFQFPPADDVKQLRDFYGRR